MTNVDVWTLMFFFFALGMVVLTGVVFSAVKREDPQLWQELGAPSLLHINAQTSIYKFWAWAFAAKRIANNLSPATSGLVFVLRVGTILFLVAFALMAVRVFVS